MRPWDDLQDGDRIELGLVQVDIAGHSKLVGSTEALRKAKAMFHRQMEGIAVSRGGRELNWAGDGGVFMFQTGDGEAFDDLVFSAIQMQSSMRGINIEIDTRTDLNVTLQIRVSCDAGNVSYARKAGEITSDFLNKFLKNERNVSLPGAVTVTDRVWKELSSKLRGRLTPFAPARNLGFELYILGGEQAELDGQEASGTTPEAAPRPAKARRLRQNRAFYRLKGSRSKQIRLIAGDLIDVNTVDIWVSSENTNMEMARFSDRSISSVIRYHGAVKNAAGIVVEDVIAQELRWKVGDMGNVPPGWIIVTGSGELVKTNKVQRIFHAAAVIGEPGRGYHPIDDVGVCVRNALRVADEPGFRKAGLKSILFPLMGTGTAGGDVRQKAEQLITAAIDYLDTNSGSQIGEVYVLAFDKTNFDICQSLAGKQKKLAPGKTS